MAKQAKKPSGRKRPYPFVQPQDLITLGREVMQRGLELVKAGEDMQRQCGADSGVFIGKLRLVRMANKVIIETTNDISTAIQTGDTVKNTSPKAKNAHSIWDDDGEE